MVAAIAAAASLVFAPSCTLAFSPHSPAANSPLFRQRPDHHRLPSSPTLLHVATPTANAAVDGEAASVAVDIPAIDSAANVNESPSFGSDEFNWFKVRFRFGAVVREEFGAVVRVIRVEFGARNMN